MKALAIALALFAAPAFAADSPPTVTLTQDQLSRLIEAETSKAIAGFVSQQEAAKAKDVYGAVQAAFPPKSAAK